ncbi:MAG: sensor histidine kinase [Armatimonadota bacterium]|nr:sensor histidine kinase [bacterium]
MRKGRQSPEIVALKSMWPALVFAGVWLQFEETRRHLPIDAAYGYVLLGAIALVMIYRASVAIRRPNAHILRYMPIFDAVLLALTIRFTGGIESELWLFYYFMLIAGAMDPRPRTIELIAPLVLISYIAATLPPLGAWDWQIIEIAGTRLLFLFLASLLTRQVGLARGRLSDEIGRLSEQLALSQERNRIAREIHDGVGHSLVNCILTLELCERLVSKDPNEACKIISQEKDDLRSALDEMRDYVRHLRPAEIENEALVPLIQRHIAHFADRTGLSARIKGAGSNIDLAPSSRLVLLRIIQEALTNSVKHSDATEVEVSLARTGDGGVHCIITDNGCGFEENDVLNDPASRQGFGLRTMKDRASGVGGDVQIESEPGKGTRVSVYVPG